jgi:predicted DNA-binding WGR domain protein
MSSSVKPKMDASERAARDLLNRKVREGLMDRRNANELLKMGLPFVRMMIAQWRREGTSPQWLTDKFQAKRAEAEQQLAAATNEFAERRARTAIIATEMYLAIWAGMQEDLGQFTAERRVERPAIEV